MWMSENLKKWSALCCLGLVEHTMYCKMEVDGNLNDAILEPRRELLSSRRRRAAYEDVLSALDDDFYDNFDDE